MNSFDMHPQTRRRRQGLLAMRALLRLLAFPHFLFIVAFLVLDHY